MNSGSGRPRTQHRAGIDRHHAPGGGGKPTSLVQPISLPLDGRRNARVTTFTCDGLRRSVGAAAGHGRGGNPLDGGRDEAGEANGEAKGRRN